MKGEKDTLPATANPDNLYWVMAENKFMYLPTRTLFERAAVVRQVGGEMAMMIEKKKVCSNLFWAPGMPTFLEDRAVVNGILYEFPGNNLLNTYKVPELELQGDPEGAGFWLELGEYLFGNQLHHMIQCLAFKVQHPDVKINHALVMGSYDQGIGKDAWLAPVQTAIGAHNFSSVTAAVAREWTLKGFTETILQNVISRISEVHDLGVDRFKFYDMTKDWAVAPPENVKVADKNVKPHFIANVVLMIYSTNHKTDGMFWPAEDRRHYFAWSDRTRANMQEKRWRDYWNDWGDYAKHIVRDDEKKDEYFKGYYHHLKQGADYHVAAYLMQPELIAGFNPGASPPHTAAWRAVVSANRNPQDSELLDVLDGLAVALAPEDLEPWDDPERPKALTISMIVSFPKCPVNVRAFFSDPKNSRAWPHRLETAGYTSVDNPDAKDGLWRVAGKRQVIYVRRGLDPDAALRAAREDLIRNPAPESPPPTSSEDFEP